jgi:hypothetical protein
MTWHKSIYRETLVCNAYGASCCSKETIKEKMSQRKLKTEDEEGNDNDKAE